MLRISRLRLAWPLHLEPSVRKAMRTTFELPGFFTVVPEYTQVDQLAAKRAMLELTRLNLGECTVLTQQYTVHPAATMFARGSVTEIKGQAPLVVFVKNYEPEWVELGDGLLRSGLGTSLSVLEQYDAKTTSKIYDGNQHQLKKLSTIFRVLFSLMISVHGVEYVT